MCGEGRVVCIGCDTGNGFSGGCGCGGHCGFSIIAVVVMIVVVDVVAVR